MRLLALAAAFAATVSAAQAGPAGDLLKQHLYAGTLAEGIEALSVPTLVADPEAQFGVGLLTFAQGQANTPAVFVTIIMHLACGRSWDPSGPVQRIGCHTEDGLLGRVRSVRR